MPRRPLLLLLASLLAAAPSAAAEETLRAADVTERGRDVAHILDMVLVPQGGVPSDGRVILFLLDATRSLGASDFPGELEAALERHERVLAGTRLAVARVGGADRLEVAPTRDRARVAAAARAVCARPDTAFQNVYAEVRRAVGALKGKRGALEVVLVTLENGDAEDDVERTVSALRRARVRLSVICREAFLSDTYWILNPPKGPPGTTFTGSDGAFVDVPWGFRFQWIVPNNTVLSGFAMYGLTRLAAATGGKVYLYYPPSGIGHACCGHSQCRCLFCDADHAPFDVYQPHRLRAMTPLAGSRDDVLRAAAADPWYQAVQRAWEQASRDGLVYSNPGIECRGAHVRLTRTAYRGWAPLGSTVAFDSEVARALRLVADCDSILDAMGREFERARQQGGSERFRAVAETTRLMVQVTRFNLLHYVAFCEEVGPRQASRRDGSYDPPERAPVPGASGYRGIGYLNLSLCHGVAPFRAIRLPGGEALRRELFALEVRWDAYMKRWDHTPFAAAVRRLGLTQHYLIVRPSYRPPGERRVPDTETDEAATLPERPARPARPGGGTSDPGGPTSGG